MEVEGRLKKEVIICIYTYGGFTLLYWRREWQTTSAFCLENLINSMKRQKDITPKDAPSMSVGVQNVTGEEQRNSPRGMKSLAQSRNDTHFWMPLVVKVK